MFSQLLDIGNKNICGTKLTYIRDSLFTGSAVTANCNGVRKIV